MTRVIIHAGFHKTGTSSLQDYLGGNRTGFKPYADIYLKKDFLKAGNLGRRYGLQPYLRRRMQFRFALREFYNSIPRANTIILSWEGFSGVMPGHRRLGGRTIKNYTRSAIPLAKELVKETQRRFGKETQIEFLYTLRESESWAKSVYGHLSRSIRIETDFDGFCRKFHAIPDLETEAELIASQIAPCLVHTAWLEKNKESRFGPVQAIIDLLDIPEKALTQFPDAKRRNVGQSKETIEKFHELNCSIKDSAELKARKMALLESKPEQHSTLRKNCDKSSE